MGRFFQDVSNMEISQSNGYVRGSGHSPWPEKCFYCGQRLSACLKPCMHNVRGAGEPQCQQACVIKVSLST